MSGRQQSEQGLRLVRDRDVRALEAVRAVGHEYGLPTADLKPCVAVLLDGNLGGTERHDAAYVIAIDLRRAGLDEAAVEKVLGRWATRIGYGRSNIRRAIRSAFAKTPGGNFRYHPPGLTKKPGTVYERVLAATCADVGCPANCAPLSGVHRGLNTETFERFERLGWPRQLRRARRAAAVDWYEAVCKVEQERGFTCGARLYVSWQALAARAARDRSKAGENLDYLLAAGLLACFERGGGSGPAARDRYASTVSRAVPIPAPAPIAAITTGGGPHPYMGGPPQQSRPIYGSPTDHKVSAGSRDHPRDQDHA